MFEKVSSERMNREQSAIFLQIYANISPMQAHNVRQKHWYKIVIFWQDTYYYLWEEVCICKYN